MHTIPASRARLESALAAFGLRLHGGWVPSTEDVLPALPGAARPAVVWMVGQVGSECWSAFSASPFFGDGLPDPMDRWAKSIGNALAHTSGGIALYPSDGPPYYPFQQWAARAEPLQSSPLLLLIHPEFGLWQAQRFALVLPTLASQDTAAIARTAATANPDVCLQCDGQPCLSACPVAAFSTSGYAVDRCVKHLHGVAGDSCMPNGCLARLVCPVGPTYRYAPPHAAFHMAAFAATAGASEVCAPRICLVQNIDS